MIRFLVGAAAIALLSGAAMAAGDLPDDGNVVPPHSGSSAPDDSSPADSGDGDSGDQSDSGGTQLPGDGNIVPPHSGGSGSSSDDSGPSHPPPTQQQPQQDQHPAVHQPDETI